MAITITKIDSSLIKLISSSDQVDNSRVTINDNFRHLKATIKSVWDILDTVVDYSQISQQNNSLGSITLHSDVDTASSPPAIGQFMKWDGSKWVPGSPTINLPTVPSYVSDLDDVENYKSGIADRDMLIWSNSNSRFEAGKLSLNDMSDVSAPGSGSGMLIRSGYSWTILGLGGTGFVHSDSGTVTLKQQDIGDLGDVVDASNPVTNKNHVLKRTSGSEYTITEVEYGIRKKVDAGDTLIVNEYYQYIVYGEMIVDGTVDLTNGGQLVVLQ